MWACPPVLVPDQPGLAAERGQINQIGLRPILQLGAPTAFPAPPILLAARHMDPQRTTGHVLNSDNVNVGKSNKKFTHSHSIDFHRGPFGNQVSFREPPDSQGPCLCPGRNANPPLKSEEPANRLQDVFGCESHAEVEVAWGVYQKMIAAYREPDRAKGRQLMSALIETGTQEVAGTLTEIVTLGRTLKKRAVDILAYFERPRSSNGPTEAINGRLEHLRGSALGFRNLTNYIARSLLESGGFRPQIHRGL